MPKCKHEKFRSEVDVNRLTDDDGNVVGYSADIRIYCAQCQTPFSWIGPKIGVNPQYPTVGYDGLELRAPIAPYGD